MRKVLLSVGAMLLSVFMVTSSFAGVVSDDVSVVVNGDKVVFADVGPIIKEGRTLIPLRGVFETLGAKVEWSQDYPNDVYIDDGITWVMVQIGSQDMVVNNKVVKLDVPAELINNRTMIPLRAVSEALGVEVQWNDESRSVYIYGDEEVYGIENGVLAENLEGEYLKHSISLDYPIIQGDSEIIKKVNASLKEDAEKSFNENLDNAKLTFSETEEWLKEETINGGEYLPPNEYQDTTTFDVTCNNGEYLSIRFLTYSFYGGAHGGTYIDCVTYDMTTGEIVTAEELMDMTKDEVYELVKLETQKFCKEELDGFSPEDFYGMIEGYDMYSAYFWYITEKDIVFGHQQYAIGPYAMGIVEVKVPLNVTEVTGVLTDGAMHTLVLMDENEDLINVSKIKSYDRQVETEAIDGLMIGDVITVQYVLRKPVKIFEITDYSSELAKIKEKVLG